MDWGSVFCPSPSSAVMKVSDILVDLRLKPQKQSSILDFVEKSTVSRVALHMHPMFDIVSSGSTPLKFQ